MFSFAPVEVSTTIFPFLWRQVFSITLGPMKLFAWEAMILVLPLFISHASMLLFIMLLMFFNLTICPCWFSFCFADLLYILGDCRQWHLLYQLGQGGHFPFLLTSLCLSQYFLLYFFFVQVSSFSCRQLYCCCIQP